MTPNKDWSEYYQITKSMPPSKLLVKALEYVKNKGKAIDIGAGALKDSIFLLQEGFDVTAIDKSPLMEEYAKTISHAKFHPITTTFEDFAFPENEYDLVTSMSSLPFTHPDYFNNVFEKIKKSLKKGGIFSASLFGVNDEWAHNPHMTFHTKEKVMNLLRDFEVLVFREEEEDGKLANGTPKHWHVFRVIARK